MKTILITGDKDLDNMLASCLRSTTIKNYAYCWRMFYDFCLSKNKINEVNFDLILLYFKYLILTKRFIFSTIKCHRSALADPLKLIFGCDIFIHIKFQLLFKYSKTNSPKVDNFYPIWDIDKVLGFITSDNFDELAITDNTWYIKKYLFLVAVAASRRISEFHALSLNESHFNNDGSVSLNPHKKFLAKNHSDSYHPKPIPIPSLPLKKICPVQALREYIELSHQICLELSIPRSEKLWINNKGKPLAKNHIRHYFRSIILQADPNARLEDTNFHSVRKVTSSQVYRHFDINTVISSLCWKSSSTFFKYYQKFGLKASSPAVVAGRLINT